MTDHHEDEDEAIRRLVQRAYAADPDSGGFDVTAGLREVHQRAMQAEEARKAELRNVLVAVVGGSYPVAGGSASDPSPTPLPTATNKDHETAWRLVHRAQEGDALAFGELYDRYIDTVYRYVLFRVGDRQLAEDLTSETFVRALRRISSVSYQGRDIGAWFITIARNLVLDHVKSSRYRFEVLTADVADVPGRSTGVARAPEGEVVAAAANAELMRCIAKLDPDQQECIVLRFLQGLSVAETAAHMGRDENATKALQTRAVRRLAQLLPKGL
jgi:RNA polymerase sigma-70 factor (ECF subfamily)